MGLGRQEGFVAGAFVVGGFDENFGEGGAVELSFDVGAVDVHGAAAEVELFSDFAGGEAAANGVEDFGFAGGEAFDAAGGFFFGGGRVDKEGLDGGADVGLAGEDVAQGGDEGFFGLVFHDVALGAGLQGFGGEGDFVVHGEDEDFGGDAVGAGGAYPVEAAAVAQGEVEDDAVGVVLGEGGEAFFVGAGFGDDGEVGFAGEEGGKSLAHDGVVVHEE